jgi:hypothetical protein
VLPNPKTSVSAQDTSFNPIFSSFSFQDIKTVLDEMENTENRIIAVYP